MSSDTQVHSPKTEARCVAVGIDVGYSADRSAIAVAHVSRAIEDDNKPRAYIDLRFLHVLEPGTDAESTISILVDKITGAADAFPDLPVVVGVDGVGVGATMAESLRTRIRRAVENPRNIKVGAIVATGGDHENPLKAGVALDWRRSVPAVKLIEDIRTALTWKRANDPTCKRLKWYEAPDTERLSTDLASLQYIDTGTRIRIKAPRTQDGHCDSASAVALAVNIAQHQAAVPPSSLGGYGQPVGIWEKSKRHHDMITDVAARTKLPTAFQPWRRSS